jgi:hypothetical protein
LKPVYIKLNMVLMRSFFLISFLIFFITFHQTNAQTYCVNFEGVTQEYNGLTYDNALFYSESSIDFRFKSGWLAPEFSFIRIEPLSLWSGSYGNDNFSGNKLHWQEAYTHVLLNNLPSGMKTIRFDLNSYGDKILMEDIQVWGTGAFSIAQDTNSLLYGTIVQIVGEIDSIAIGAAFHNDYVIDNFCVDVETANIMDLSMHQFSVYPNPADQWFTINVLSDPQTEAYLLDNAGRVLRSIESNEFSEVDVSNLPDGVYFVHLISTSEQSSLMFTVRH